MIKQLKIKLLNIKLERKNKKTKRIRFITIMIDKYFLILKVAYFSFNFLYQEHNAAAGNTIKANPINQNIKSDANLIKK